MRIKNDVACRTKRNAKLGLLGEAK
jgi:hypothetical protein